jgi:hypothetical protein
LLSKWRATADEVIVRYIAPNESAPARDAALTCRATAEAKIVGLIVIGLKPSLVPILLGARNAQSCEAMQVNGVLPGEEFFDSEHVAAARFVKREQATAYGRDDQSFAPDHPAVCARRW